jgi:hypothetical protein
MVVSVLPAQNGSANQKMKKSTVSGRDSPAHIGFIGIRIANEKLSLGQELFGQIDNHAASLIHEV